MLGFLGQFPAGRLGVTPSRLEGARVPLVLKEPQEGPVPLPFGTSKLLDGSHHPLYWALPAGLRPPAVLPVCGLSALSL
ncbi:hypothetical protein GCM10010255_78460 [Streptomyces coeruleofuscus]|uniref:Uncharacterized protein n=1 Tax=Streptomyces coeruleofuscus TaxID=66879 RepID=A0ABN3JBB6_9ACTN